MSFAALPIAILLAITPGNGTAARPAAPGMAAGAEMAEQCFPPVALSAVPTGDSPQPPAVQASSAQGAPSEKPANPAKPESKNGQPEIVVTGNRHALPTDPLAKVNAQSFAISEAVDQALIGPVSLAYARTVPRPVRTGVLNFVHNLHEPVVALNFLLQLKLGKTAETVARFGINSTIGVAGLIDVAKRRPFRLRRRQNGFADTLGYYGLKPGPFFYLPLIGPTTTRDLVGLVVDRLLLPFSVGNFVRPLRRVTGPAAILKTLDNRSDFDDALQLLREAPDPYAARRDLYLRLRQQEIDELRGRHRSPVTPAPGTSSVGADRTRAACPSPGA